MNLNESSESFGAQVRESAAVAIDRTNSYKRNWPGGIPERQ